MRVVYGTIATESFAPAALVLARSLVAVSPAAEVFLFALDEGAARIFKALAPERCVTVSFDEFAGKELRSTRHTLKISAFCWLSKPFAMAHLMRARPNCDWFCYVDSDMMAFADPAARLVEARGRSVVVTPHAFRYPPFIGTEYHYGRFNAGFIAFRNDDAGKAIHSWWRDKCVANCPAEPEADAFGDQKYIEAMAHLFYDQVSVGFPFTNCAAWNIGRDVVEQSDSRVLWRERQILIYHFQGLRLLSGGWVDLYGDRFALSRSVKHCLYRPYVKALRKAVADIHGQGLSNLRFAIDISPGRLFYRVVQTGLRQRSLVSWP